MNQLSVRNLALACLAIITSSFCSAQSIQDAWRYEFTRPGNGWQKTDFDDSGWKQGFGGFGTHETPGSRISTEWATDDIWLRKTVQVAEIPQKPALLIFYDEDAQVFINGQQVGEFRGYTTRYISVLIPEEHQSAIQTGNNVVAVHCNQTKGGQFIDVHLVDAAADLPELPPAKRSTTPFQSDLITQWGSEVTAENAWTEYPRPLMQRDDWTNLNGHWDYAITSTSQTKTPTAWQGKILVPYCLESRLGGVQRLLNGDETLWYHRKIDLPTIATNKRILLNFEAVDYRCEVLVNGRSVGQHQGGNTPFSVDITRAIRQGENALVVRVHDETEKWQLRGKQTLNARGIWYTQVSGIWQTVWMESVPQSHFSDLKISTDAVAHSITVHASWDGQAAGFQVAVKNGPSTIANSGSSGTATLTIPNATLWSPANPHLYELEITLVDTNGQPLDRVQSYAGIRTVGKTQNDDGHWRFTLNGETLFHWGPLDQGWWPDGLLTPPSDEAMQFDIQWLKDAGFNMIRKHIKVEPRRYYYHCDRLGMMLWQDHVSGGREPNWTRLQPDPQDAAWPDNEHEQFMLELDRMISTLESHPSIVSWVPFNERWGQHRTVEVGEWTVKRDPSRLVNIASGGNFWSVGDVVDAHSYPHPEFPFEDGEGGRFNDYIKVMGEFGGHGYAVREHLWDANRRNWGYGGLPQDESEYRDRYTTSLKMLNDLRKRGIAAGVYTQTTDVEGEINGLMTYDRKVIKIPANELSEMHKVLFED